MAVLVEAISIIIRRNAIDRVYPGGYEGFSVDVPNSTLCADDTLARVGFLTAAEAGEFVRGLEAHGFIHLDAGEAVDFSLVDQVDGPMEPCRWLAFGGFVYGEAGRVAACWLCDNPWIHWGAVTPDEVMEVATPVGWTYERSMSWALDRGKARRVRTGTSTATGGTRQMEALLPAPRPIPLGPAHNRLH